MTFSLRLAHSPRAPLFLLSHILVPFLLTAALLLPAPTLLAADPTPPPSLTIGDIRAARAASVQFALTTDNLPPNLFIAEFTLDFQIDGIEAFTLRPAHPGAQAAAQPIPNRPGAWQCRIEAPAEAPLSSGPLATISFTAPRRMVPRTAILISGAQALSAHASPPTPLVNEPASFAVSLITEPLSLFTFFASCIAGIFWLSRRKPLEKFFRFFPPLIWTYFIPMLATTIGVTPDDSPLYSPFMSRVILPAVLVLLLIPSDVKGIMKLGWRALFMMLIATASIVTGAIASFALFTAIAPGAIPEGTWKGIAALSGSWIGGSPNMFAVIESLATPANIIGPLVVVDTVCAYSWLGLLIALSAYQTKIDRFHKADSRVIDEISAKLEAEQQAHARAPKTSDIAMMIGVAFLVSAICLALGKPMAWLVETKWGFKQFGQIINAFGWGILFITAAGLLLSFTRIRELDFCGASSIGNLGLYLLLTTYGARANLRAVLEVPVFFGIGVVWILVHIVILYAGMRLLRAPLFLAATSSMANIGGTASAPVVAAAYNPSMAPVGLLMAILGSILGTPLALFVVAVICRSLSGQ